MELEGGDLSSRPLFTSFSAGFVACDVVVFRECNFFLVKDFTIRCKVRGRKFEFSAKYCYETCLFVSFFVPVVSSSHFRLRLEDAPQERSLGLLYFWKHRELNSAKIFNPTLHFLDVKFHLSEYLI